MPVPTIFLIDNNSQITEMKGQPYDSEARLQSLLAKFPSVLAGDQMSGSAPLKWLLIKQEAGIPGEDGGAERWSVDHLFIDQNGIPTIVEVKRSTDTRIRREVVGQMLDYAANAVQYWPIKTIREWFEETCGDVDPNVHLAEVIGLTDASDEAVSGFWQTVEANLRAGRLRLIFAADEIPPELRRIIEFLDEHMTPTEVVGIEIQQYVGPNGHTLVPSVIRSSRKSTQTTGRTAIQWNQNSFITDLRQRRGANAVAVGEKILEWASKQGVTVAWGQGRRDGSCNLGVTYNGATFYPFTMWTYGRIQIAYQILQQQSVATKLIEELASGLKTIPGTPMIPDMLNRSPTFEMSVLKDQSMMNRFLEVIRPLIEQLNNDPKSSSATPNLDSKVASAGE